MNVADRSISSRSQKGITLLELMIVVVIVGILAAVAYPSYREQVRRSNRSEGRTMLQNAAAVQERFFSNRNTYATLAELVAQGIPATSENGYYTLTVPAVDGTSYTLRVATAAGGGQADDAHCATMTLTSTGVKGGTNADCWP